MFKDQLADRVAFEIQDNGDVFINGKEARFIDSAFLCYYLIQKGDAYPVLAFLDKYAQQNENPALWLWLMGEYINRSNDTEAAKIYAERIEQMVDDIALQWKKPRSNWLGLPGDDVYISNIAMAFGAAQSIYNAVRIESAQKLVKELSDVLFERFLAEGKVVSGIANREVMGDIGMIAVPFGLMDAGNQILVASIAELESSLLNGGVRLSSRDMAFGGCIRPALTCLLAWYYAQRGDVAQAKSLLLDVDKLWVKEGRLIEADTSSAKEHVFFRHQDEKPEEHLLAYVLYALADLCVSEKAGSIQTAGVCISHNPEGTGNKYLRENMQRLPVYPLENENVQVRMIAEPLGLVKKAVVQLTVDGERRKVMMQLHNSSQGERFFEADIGCFAYGQTVSYSFLVETDETPVLSDEYRFTARKWISAGSAIHTKLLQEGMKLYFSPLCEGGKTPVLSLAETDNRTHKLSFHMDDTTDVTDALSDVQELHGFIDDGGIHINNRVHSYSQHGKSWLELLTDSSGNVFKIRYNFRMEDGERFFGMGERYAAIEYRGMEIDNYVYNQYTGQKLRTYIPVPFAISSSGYAIYADTSMYSVFRFGTRAGDLLEIEVDLLTDNQKFDLFMFTGTVKETISCLSKVTGKPVLPPKWVLGPWMSSHNWDCERETLRQAALTHQYKIPATVMVLEQWSDEATFYIFNDARYDTKDGAGRFKYEDFTFPEWGRWQDPRGMVGKLHEQGLKVFLWQAPVQKDMDGIVHAQRDEDERVMLEKGYCVKRADGSAYRVPVYEWFKRSLIPDFTNPDAKKWWLNKRRYLMDEIGIDGFKSDGGECIYGEDVLFFDGRTGEEMRNLYPNTYISSFYEFAKEHVKGGTVTFSRAGYTGAQKIPLHWAGDENSTFEAYRSSIRAGLSCSMSGIPFWGWDIGGFHGEIPSAELYVRSTQFAAFCPVMQYHAETKGEQNRDRTPWNIAERTGKQYVLDIYKKFADLRMNMLPYIYEQAKVSCETGLPLMRAMAVEYPQDKACSQMTWQYFFGEKLLVAPVTEEGCSVKDVYLPEGKWLNFFEDTEYPHEGLVTMPAGIETIPVLMRQDSIIPLNLADDLKLRSHVGNNVDDYQSLCFMVYVKDCAASHFDDDTGNGFEIVTRNSQGGMHITVSGQIVQPVTMIIRQTNLRQVVQNGKTLTQCSMEALSEDTFAVRENSLYIRIIGEADISIT